MDTNTFIFQNSDKEDSIFKEKKVLHLDPNEHLILLNNDASETNSDEKANSSEKKGSSPSEKGKKTSIMQSILDFQKALERLGELDKELSEITLIGSGNPSENKQLIPILSEYNKAIKSAKVLFLSLTLKIKIQQNTLDPKLKLKFITLSARMKSFIDHYNAITIMLGLSPDQTLPSSNLANTSSSQQSSTLDFLVDFFKLPISRSLKQISQYDYIGGDTIQDWDLSIDNTNSLVLPKDYLFNQETYSKEIVSLNGYIIRSVEKDILYALFYLYEDQSIDPFPLQSDLSLWNKSKALSIGTPPKVELLDDEPFVKIESGRVRSGRNMSLTKALNSILRYGDNNSDNPAWEDWLSKYKRFIFLLKEKLGSKKLKFDPREYSPEMKRIRSEMMKGPANWGEIALQSYELKEMKEIDKRLINNVLRYHIYKIFFYTKTLFWFPVESSFQRYGHTRTSIKMVLSITPFFIENIRINGSKFTFIDPIMSNPNFSDYLSHLRTLSNRFAIESLQHPSNMNDLKSMVSTISDGSAIWDDIEEDIEESDFY